MNKKSGFTLAEVLVTLMIIGVIAAMTIPSLMQSTAQQEYRVAFKKAVSMLNQAVTLNYALDGVDASDKTGTAFAEILNSRLNVMSTAGATTKIYTADGMYFEVSTTGAKACSLENGSSSNNVCSVVKVDVNGQKGPNIESAANKVRDIFTVAIYPQKALPGTEAYAKLLFEK